MPPLAQTLLKHAFVRTSPGLYTEEQQAKTDNTVYKEQPEQETDITDTIVVLKQHD